MSQPGNAQSIPFHSRENLFRERRCRHPQRADELGHWGSSSEAPSPKTRSQSRVSCAHVQRPTSALLDSFYSLFRFDRFIFHRTPMDTALQSLGFLIGTGGNGSRCEWPGMRSGSALSRSRERLCRCERGMACWVCIVGEARMRTGEGHIEGRSAAVGLALSCVVLTFVR